VELEVLSLGLDDAKPVETDARTYDNDAAAHEDLSPEVTVSELRSHLRSRKKTISQLQFDLQKLHTKWQGLETEIGARKSQTVQLNNELTTSRATILGKNRLLKKRDRKIKVLKSEIRQRDENFRQLTSRNDEISHTLEAPPSQAEKAAHQDDDFPRQLARIEEYADLLRQQYQDLIATNSRTEREVDNLTFRLDDVTQENTQLSEDLELSAAAIDRLQSTLSDIQSQHEEEIRMLRFELGSAQNTVVESDELNSQLTSDLVDARGFNDELERMLGDVEEQSSDRIEKMQKEVSKLHRSAESYEQKLTTKNGAISILLSELAKRSEQIESIGEVEEVIQDIDDRMSERRIGGDQNETRPTTDRITRVLIGSIDGQVLRFPLFKDRLTIGRTKDNDIQIKAGYVSRRHAVIQTDGEMTRIIDWGSKNGIHVNSAKVAEHRLSHGDTVMIGNARFRYEERKKRDSGG
jgi:chromosome segregation ATPase